MCKLITKYTYNDTERMVKYDDHHDTPGAIYFDYNVKNLWSSWIGRTNEDSMNKSTAHVIIRG